MASKRHQRRKQCEGKNQYRTMKAAAKTIAIAVTRGEILNAYLCPFCRYLHVGHTPGVQSQHRIANRY